MTLKIDRESLPCSPEDFARIVGAHAQAVAEYAAHLRGVEEDAANPNLTPDQRRVAFPGPSAHPLIEAAVEAGDFELVGPSIHIRKQRLAQKVAEAERAELEKVSPELKRRHFTFEEDRIRREDMERWSAYCAAHASDGRVPDARQMPEFCASERPLNDTAFLKDMQARHAKVAAIQRRAAKAYHDIDDLTEETVDGWKLEAFVG